MLFGSILEPLFTDTDFDSVDGQPLVFYKWEVYYDEEMLIGASECASTFVGSCIGNTETIDVSAAWPGTIDSDNNPLVNINWSVPPSIASAPDDFIVRMYVDGYMTYDELDIQTHSIQTTMGSNTGDQHTVQIVATNLCSGCEIVSNELNLTIPSYEVDCPTTQDTMHVITNILGPYGADTISVQLLWTGAMGEIVKIYHSATGEAGSYTLLTEVGSTENSYVDNTVQSGQTVYYYLKSVTYNGVEQACVKATSEIEQVVAAPMVGQETGTVYFYVRDHLGNSRLVLDVDGNIQSRFNYEPYGVELTPLGANTTNEKYKYTGQERDYDTGLDYMHFRYYASSMGRFLKPDNMIPNPANPQSWNLYSYVNNSPINFNDPTGHDIRGKQGKMGMHQALMGVPNVDISGMLTEVEIYEYFSGNVHSENYQTVGEYYKRLYHSSQAGGGKTFTITASNVQGAAASLISFLKKSPSTSTVYIIYLATDTSEFVTESRKEIQAAIADAGYTVVLEPITSYQQISGKVAGMQREAVGVIVSHYENGYFYNEAERDKGGKYEQISREDMVAQLANSNFSRLAFWGCNTSTAAKQARWMLGIPTTYGTSCIVYPYPLNPEYGAMVYGP